MAVDRCNHGLGKRERRRQHGAQRRQEFLDVGHAAVEQQRQIDASGKDPPGAGEDDRGCRRALDLAKARRHRATEIEAHGVGLAVRHPQDRVATLVAELDHVGCSRPRMAATPESSRPGAGRWTRTWKSCG